MRKLTCFVAAIALVTVGRPSMGQALTFGSGGVGSYAVLNGDNLALYVDEYGDLGAPQNSGIPNKPGGVLNSSGQPYINSDGSVNTLGGTNAYGALYSPTSTAGDSIQAAVQAKTEYVTLGNRNAIEGWSVDMNGAKAFTPYSDMPTPTFSVSSNSATGLLTMTSTTTLAQGNADLQISQEILFNDPGRKNIAQFTVNFTNTGTTTITGLQYARIVDPNQDVAAGGSVNTVQSFGAQADPKAFAINSTGSLSGNQMALGVQPTDQNAAGSTIYAVNGLMTETGTLGHPSYLDGQSGNNYIQLNANGVGATYVNATNSALDATTSNFQAYINNPASAPFLTASDASVNPDFSSFGSDTTLVLLSPDLPDLAPGASTSYTFYYIFGPGPEGAPVPEPGPVAALFAPLVSMGCATLLRHRRTVRS
jgi:hypothetical protein